MGGAFSTLREVPDRVYTASRDNVLVIAREWRREDEELLVRDSDGAVRLQRWSDTVRQLAAFARNDFTLPPDETEEEMVRVLTTEAGAVITAQLRNNAGVRQYLGFAFVTLNDTLEYLVVAPAFRGGPLRVGSRLLAMYEDLIGPGHTATIQVLNRPGTRAFYAARGYVLRRTTPLAPVDDRDWQRLQQSGKLRPGLQMTTIVTKVIPQPPPAGQVAEPPFVDLTALGDDWAAADVPVFPAGTRSNPIVIDDDDSDDDGVQIIGQSFNALRVQAWAERSGFTFAASLVPPPPLPWQHQ